MLVSRSDDELVNAIFRALKDYVPGALKRLRDAQEPVEAWARSVYLPAARIIERGTQLRAFWCEFPRKANDLKLVSFLSISGTYSPEAASLRRTARWAPLPNEDLKAFTKRTAGLFLEIEKLETPKRRRRRRPDYRTVEREAAWFVLNVVRGLKPADVLLQLEAKEDDASPYEPADVRAAVVRIRRRLQLPQEMPRTKSSALRHAG